MRTGLLKDTVVDGISQSAREAVDVIEEVRCYIFLPVSSVRK